MAEDADEQWLYGEVIDGQKEETENTESLKPDDEEKSSIEKSGLDRSENEHKGDEDQSIPNETKNEDEDDDESDDDDDIQVTIGEYKSGPEVLSYDLGSVPLKRPYPTPKPDKQQMNLTSGGVTMLDIESFGMINGEPAHEFNLDALEDKPWRKPGADITDYFNYGFTEDTWKSYCERQRRLRSEAGATPILAGGKMQNIIPIQVINDNSKYSGLGGIKKAGPPPGRRFAGCIDVIGGSISSRRSAEQALPNDNVVTSNENVIQVMTADKREYSRKQTMPDLSLPPPDLGVPPLTFDVPPPLVSTPQPSFNGQQFSNQDSFFQPPGDTYFQSYEPTQDSQWNSSQNWGPGQAPPPPSFITPVATSETSETESKKSSRHRSRSREQSTKSGDRDDKHRSSSHRRHRSSSRSPDRHRDRHRDRRSRSRSPRHHRSHKRSKRDRDE